MKKYSFLLLVLINFIFISCEKEEIYEEDNPPYYVDSNSGDDGTDTDTIIFGDTTTHTIDYIPDSLVLGYEWTLIDGRVYVEI